MIDNRLSANEVLGIMMFFIIVGLIANRLIG